MTLVNLSATRLATYVLKAEGNSSKKIVVGTYLDYFICISDSCCGLVLLFLLYIFFLHFMPYSVLTIGNHNCKLFFYCLQAVVISNIKRKIGFHVIWNFKTNTYLILTLSLIIRIEKYQF